MFVQRKPVALEWPDGNGKIMNSELCANNFGGVVAYQLPAQTPVFHQRSGHAVSPSPCRCTWSADPPTPWQFCISQQVYRSVSNYCRTSGVAVSAPDMTVITPSLLTNTQCKTSLRTVKTVVAVVTVATIVTDATVFSSVGCDNNDYC